MNAIHLIVFVLLIAAVASWIFYMLMFRPLKRYESHAGFGSLLSDDQSNMAAAAGHHDNAGAA